MSIINSVRSLVVRALEDLYQHKFREDEITVNLTKPEFEGDYTVVLFSLLKPLRKAPDQLGNELGDYLVKNHDTLVSDYNLIKGFLNLNINKKVWLEFLYRESANDNYGFHKGENRETVSVEYSSPNTNKPLHLGHLRNNFLGWSVAAILEATGKRVIKNCVVNDRGIHICKSMIAWQKFGKGADPESTGVKGDHLVGEYYVQFETELKAQTDTLLKRFEEGDFSTVSDEEKEKIKTALSDKDQLKEIARNNTPIMHEAKEMLRKWEAGDEEVLSIWRMMNGWVYKGFDETYARIGSDFQKIYYESETYLLGKRIVEEGLASGVFFRKEDGSVWIDLEAEGLDQKLLLRRDGTSVYITQDLGLADEKYRDFKYNQSLYVIADEQNYHMKVLKLILQKLGKPYADGIHHLSYGMVDLPSGRMKSREGTVVDADDIVAEMASVAEKHTKELGKVGDFTEDELKELYDTLGLGALKFYLLRVDPKKRMIFNPEESIDFHGFTGPFVQYTNARIRSILRKEKPQQKTIADNIDLLPKEKDLILMLEQFPLILSQAAAEFNPSVIAIYVFNLAKEFNAFYTVHSVLNAENDEKKQLRLQLSQLTANVIKNGMGLLGIRVPERM